MPNVLDTKTGTYTSQQKREKMQESVCAFLWFFLLLLLVLGFVGVDPDDERGGEEVKV